MYKQFIYVVFANARCTHILFTYACPLIEHALYIHKILSLNIYNYHTYIHKHMVVSFLRILIMNINTCRRSRRWKQIVKALFFQQQQNRLIF